MSDEHEIRLNNMKIAIIRTEAKNLRSPHSDIEMVEKIRKIIVDEANKIYGGKRNVN